MKKYILMIALAITSLFLFNIEADAANVVVCSYSNKTVTVNIEWDLGDNSFFAIYDDDGGLFNFSENDVYLLSYKSEDKMDKERAVISKDAYEAISKRGECPERAFYDDDGGYVCFDGGGGYCQDIDDGGFICSPEICHAEFYGDTQVKLKTDYYHELESDVIEGMSDISLDDLTLDNCGSTELATFINIKISDKANTYLAGYPSSAQDRIENLIETGLEEEKAALIEEGQKICTSLANVAKATGDITEAEANAIVEEVKLVTSEDIGSGLSLSTSEYFNFSSVEKPICGIFGKTTWGYIQTAYSLIKLFIPALIVLLGMTDFLKVLFSGDEKDMKASSVKFMKRLFAGIIFILLPILVEFLIRIVGFSENCIQQLTK